MYFGPLIEIFQWPIFKRKWLDQKPLKRSLEKMPLSRLRTAIIGLERPFADNGG